ncbi:MAG: carbohydrate kinase family protein, partial [Candidatus Woesearchaeota archaeon]
KKLFALAENKIYSLIPPDIKVIHTAGAGDAFTAGLLAGIIRNYSFEKALRIGQANASSVIQHLGTKNKLLTLKEAEQFIHQHKMRINTTKC